MPTVVPTDSRPLSWPPIGALPRNRLASSATGSASAISPTPRFPHFLSSVGRADPSPPPGLAPHLRQGTRALPYKVLRCWARADRVVRPYKIIPCRAGPMCPAAHRTANNASVGATLAVARGRGRAPPLRTSKKTHRTYVTHCHCEASAHTGRGERTERRQWRMKRGERVAAVKISSVRRKAAQKFWAPQQGHP